MYFFSFKSMVAYLLQHIFLQIEILPVTHITVIAILILILLTVMAIISGGEIAYFTLVSKDINYLKTKEESSSIKVIQLLEHPELLSSTLKAGKITCAIAVIICSNYLANLFIPISKFPILTFVIVLISITLLLLLIGEILPKVYARQNNVRMAIFSAPLIKMIYGAFRRPVSLLYDTQMIQPTRHKSKKLKLDSTEFEETVALTMGHTATKEEVDIFKGILKFGSITVKQIMQPRLDIIGLRESWSFTKVREKVTASGYTRLPVYKNNVDEITGILHTKDILPYSDLDEMDWHSVLRTPYFVYEHKLIEELFAEFQEKKVHMAIVVDEFGGTSGIITLEDIIEEIIGDIRDEFDEDDAKYYKDDDDSYIFQGKMLIIDACRAMGVRYDTFDNIKGESDSMAGLVLELASKFPQEGDQYQYEQFTFSILEIEKLKIGKIKVFIDTTFITENDE